MRILALETSGRVGSVALLAAEGGNALVVASQELPADKRTAQSLLPVVKQLLSDAGWKPAELELIAVAVGPGSFTGLRIGVVTAKTLAYATGAKLAAVHTLAALAEGVVTASAVKAGESLWAILDAQRQELFAAKFAIGSDLPAATEPATSVITNEDWIAQLVGGDIVTGPPLEKLASVLPAEVRAVDKTLWTPQAAAVGRLGHRLAIAGAITDPLALVPNYYRASAAEEKASQFDAAK